MLEEFTEVIVAPKQRQTDSSNQQLSTTTQHGYNQQENMNPPSSMLEDNSSSLSSLWNYFFPREERAVYDKCEISSESGTNIDTINTSNDTKSHSCCKSSFKEQALDLCLRSQSAFHPLDLNDKIELYTKQFSCVFVSPYSPGLKFVCRHHNNHCIDDFDGWVKTVTIRKLLSPKEKYELLNMEKRKNSKEVESVQANSKKGYYSKLLFF